MDVLEQADAAVQLAATLETDLSNDKAVADFTAAEDAFTTLRPDAAKAVRDQALFTAAEAINAKRRAAVAAAVDVIGLALPAVEAAVAAAEELPTEQQRLADRGALSVEAQLLGRLLDESTARDLRDELRRGTVEDAERLYAAAVANGNATAIRYLEAAVLAGLPDVSNRKGDSAKQATAFTRLRQAVITARAARVPAPLREAHERLTAARGRATMWAETIKAVTGPVPDLERLRLRARDYREREAAKQKAAAEAGR